MPPTYEGYERTETDPRFTDWLRKRAEPEWTRATTHQFTTDLADDSIDDAVFRRYLVQDYAFLESLVSLVGYAVGQAPSMDAKRELAGFAATLTSEENDYFERSFDALDVPDANPDYPSLPDAHQAGRVRWRLCRDTRRAGSGGVDLPRLGSAGR